MDSVNFLNLEYLFLRIFDFFKNFDIVAILNAIIHFAEKIMPFVVLLGLFLIFVIIYSSIRLKQIALQEEAKFHAVGAARQEAVKVSQDIHLAEKWQTVQAHINSDNPSQWRLAILEADIMLDDILDKMGYQGDSIGDKLKGIEKSDFLTLDAAWEAHRIRNQIAHEGSDFQLNEREAKRVIELYKAVFEEFYHL